MYNGHFLFIIQLLYFYPKSISTTKYYYKHNKTLIFYPFFLHKFSHLLTLFPIKLIAFINYIKCFLGYTLVITFHTSHDDVNLMM